MNGKRAKTQRRARPAPAAREFPEIQAVIDANTSLRVARVVEAVAQQRAHSGLDRPAVRAAQAKRERRQARNLALG